MDLQLLLELLLETINLLLEVINLLFHALCYYLFNFRAGSFHGLFLIISLLSKELV